MNSQQHRFELCAHEAAHAVVSHVLGSRRVEGLHILQDKAGFTDLGRLPTRKKKSDIRDHFESLIIVSCAGAAAEHKAKFTPWSIVGKPPLKRRPIKRNMKQSRDRVFAGMFAPTLIRNPADRTEADADFERRTCSKLFPETWGAYRYWLAQQASVLVQKQWPLILKVASRLFHLDYLSRRDFLKLIKETGK